MVREDGVPYEAWTDELHLMQEDPVDRFKAVVQKIMRVHHHLGLMRFVVFAPHPRLRRAHSQQTKGSSRR